MFNSLLASSILTPIKVNLSYNLDASPTAKPVERENAAIFLRFSALKTFCLPDCSANASYDSANSSAEPPILRISGKADLKLSLTVFDLSPVRPNLLFKLR